MTRVKICGITEVASAREVVSAGADFLGLIFAPSRRRVTTEKARQIAAEVRQLSPRPELVGVFVNARAVEVNRAAERCQLDRVQLSGDESWEYCREIKVPVIKVIHVAASKTAAEIIAAIKAGRRVCPDTEMIYLLDTHVPGAYGGTGKGFDWQIAREVADRYPVMVAGGLNPGNVGALVRTVRPWGVDVSSGVETGGQKDSAKIRAFLAAVRAAA
ncbi:MAG: phosphoribosylanthranilate isomerase [Chloroflexota bacterium]